MGSQPTKRTTTNVKVKQTNTKDDKTDDEEENDKEINLEDFMIIWLDDDPIDPRLKSVNTVTKSFSDPEKCIACIKSIKREFIYLIIGRLTTARTLLYLKQECRQIQSIYVLCIRKPEVMDQWKDAKIFTDMSLLIENLENDLQLTKNETIKIKSIKDNEDLSFIWHFLFLKLLYELPTPLNTQKQLLFKKLIHFYKNDEKQIKLIDAFQRNYRSQNALWWLTKHDEHQFLSQTLNKALRTRDYYFLSAFRFYLKDLYDQMIEMKSEIVSNKFIVYRTQKLNTIKDLIKLSNGSLIVFETFLFTQSDYPQKTDDIILEFHIQEQTSHPFARLNQNNDLIIYPMSIFRLDSSSNKFIRLIMDQKVDIKVNEIVNNAIQKYSLEPHDPIKMGLALWKLNIGTIRQAYSYHTMLIELLPPKNCLDLANLHNNLGGILKDNSSYHRALTQFEIAEKLYLKSVPHNHLYLAPTYTNIGNVHRLKKKYSQSLDYHLKALGIREKSLPPNHIDIAQSLMEVALTYHYLKLNIQSVAMIQKAKDIFELNKIPKNDPRYVQLEEALNTCERS